MHPRPSRRPAGRLVRLTCALGLAIAWMPLIGAEAEAREQQVAIAVNVVEVSEIAQRDLGFDFSALAGTLPSGVIDAPRTRGVGNRLGSADLTTRGGEGVQFGGFRDLIITGAGGRNATLPVGLQLTITPRVLGNGRVDFDLEAVRNLPDLSTEIPTLDARRFLTSSTLEPGQTLAIGGLFDDTDRQLARDVPVLGEAPIIGSLFRSEAFQRGESDLMIFVTPRLSGATGGGGGYVGTGFTVTAGGAYGEIDRGSLQLPIRREVGGVKGDALSFDTSGEDFYSAQLGLRLDLGRAFDQPTLSGKSLGLDFSYGSSEFRGFQDFFAGGDANPASDGSVLLDPDGLNGMLGGGGVVLFDNGIGFADHTDIRAESDYSEWKLGLNLGKSYRFDGLTLAPRGGFFYGATDEDVEISGVTGNGFVDYDYRNDISSDRVGARFQIYAGYEVTQGVKLFTRPYVELSQDFAEADSRVDIFTGGSPFASSEASGIDHDFTNFGYGATAGIKISPVPNLMLELSGGFQSAKVPTLESEPAEVANIDTRRRKSWVVSAGVRVSF